MKYHVLYVIFEKTAKFEIVVCCKIIGGALLVNKLLLTHRDQLFAYWVVFMLFYHLLIFLQTIFFEKKLFLNIIRVSNSLFDVLPGLIWVQVVCKSSADDTCRQRDTGNKYTQAKHFTI